jgi:hypothetical protein
VGDCGTREWSATSHGLTRHWAGDEVANELEIPDTALKHLVPLLRPAVRATDLLRRVGLSDDARIATRTRARAKTLLDVGHAPAGVVTAAEAGATVQSGTIH